MKVEWDLAKNPANQRKHGVSFEEAGELFRPGVNYLEIFDAEHSVGEDRFIAARHPRIIRENLESAA